MSVRNAVLCLSFGISAMASSVAMAHIDFGDDYECRSSYETNCTFLNADVSRRTLRIFFDGTIEENGDENHVCETRTARLMDELKNATAAVGLKANLVKIESIRYSRLGARDGYPNEYRCSYVIKTKRRDLRFSTHKFNRRFWTSVEEQNGVCMEDVRTAQAIPGSIGAAKWMTAALLQGYMCNTNYALLGLDRVETKADGSAQLIKFGSEAPSSPPETTNQDDLRGDR